MVELRDGNPSYVDMGPPPHWFWWAIIFIAVFILIILGLAIFGAVRYGRKHPKKHNNIVLIEK